MNFEKYKNLLTYPKRSDYTKFYYYKGGRVLAENVEGAIKEKVFDEEEYKKANDAYNKENARLFEEFKKDLFADLGIADNPKAEKLFSIAWDKGHSGGYSEVYNEALDLVDLITA